MNTYSQNGHNNTVHQLLVEEKSSEKQPPPNPFEGINILKRMMFGWVNPLLKVAQKKTLQQEDIFQLQDKDACSQNYKKFNEVYEQMLLDDKVKTKIQSTFYKIYKREIIIVIALYICQQLSGLLNIMFFNYLLDAFDSDNRGESFYPLLPAFGTMFACFFLFSVIKANYTFYYVMSQLTVRMTGALSMKIFEKVLQYPVYRNQFYKIGDILNMIQVDILQVVSYTQNLFSFILAFPFLGMAIYLIIKNLSSVSIVTLMIITAFVFLGISILFGNIYGVLQKKFMHEKDLRMRSLEEMMRGIKTIKYDSYQNYFENRIFDKRKKEVKQLKRQNFVSIFNAYINQLSTSAIISIVTLFIGISTFSQFFLITNAFANILDFISTLPQFIRGIVIGKNSLARLDNFFSESFIYQRAISSTSHSEVAIQLRDAVFSWKNTLKLESIQKSIKLRKSEILQLTNIQQGQTFATKPLNLTIKKGEFVVFFGEIGSGKTSILQGLLGEMEIEGGDEGFKEMVEINGELSISTQDPWVKQDTVKENIIFQQPYDDEIYNQTLHASCLLQDISQFVDGDKTNIGEKGETLSGGQRKRVNLARAIYKKADIYLLDDPLSSLDLHVANHISKECLKGMLNDKTRVVFANSLIGMEDADRIFVVKDGQIEYEGNFQQVKKYLQQKKGIYQKANEDELTSLQIYDQITQTDKHQIFQLNPHSQFTKQLIVKEDIQSGTIKKDIFQNFLKYIGGVFFLIAALLIICLLIGSDLWSRIIMLNIDNNDNPTDEQKRTQKNTILLYCLSDFLRATSQFLFDNLLVFNMAKLSTTLHRLIANKLLRASFTKFYNLITTGRVMNRLSKDIYDIDTLLYKDISAIYSTIASLIVMIVLFGLCFNYTIFPIGIVYFIFSVYVTFYFLSAKRQVVRIEALSKSPILQNLSEVIRGITFLRNCVPLNNIRLPFREAVDVDLRNQIAVNGVQFWFECIMNFMKMWPIMISSGILVIFISTFEDCSNNYLISTFKQTQAPMMQLLLHLLFLMQLTTRSFFLRLGLILKLILSILKDAPNLISKMILLMIILFFTQNNRGIILEKELGDSDEEEGLVQEENSVPQKSILSQHNSRINDIEITQNKKISIEFKNASFSYRSDIPNCLKDLNLSIRGNQKIGIVGRTGAGKTSVTLSLTKMIDLVQGDLIVNGASIKKYSLTSLRNEISVVSQEPYIFEGTLLSNLDPYNQYTQKQLYNVFNDCQLNKCKSFSQHGLNTPISQLGDNLSEGEKQLICIGRVLLKKSSIIIVDEPTSRIDELIEEQVTQVINESFKDCLLIIIAHRIKTLQQCDRILVLDNGKLREYQDIGLIKQNKQVN